MDFSNAKRLFEKYLDGYDRENDKVRLKIVHTYGVVKQSEEIAGRLAAVDIVESAQKPLEQKSII